MDEAIFEGEQFDASEVPIFQIQAGGLVARKAPADWTNRLDAAEQAASDIGELSLSVLLDAEDVFTGVRFIRRVSGRLFVVEMIAADGRTIHAFSPREGMAMQFFLNDGMRFAQANFALVAARSAQKNAD